MKKICPLIDGECLEHKCMLFVHITGQHPQSGVTMDQWDCSFRWMPIVMLENARHTVGVQAAVESTRNEIVTRQETLNNLITQASRRPAQIHDVGASEQISDAREKNGP